MMPISEKLQIVTSGDREIVITRTFHAPRILVFDAWTKPELLKRWLLGPPGWSFAMCESDLRVGGRYRFVWRKAGVPDMGMSGVYREVVPPERIVNTQVFDQDWTGGEAIGTLVLTENEGKTTTINTILYSSREARDGAACSGMAEGMEAGYARLDEILANLA